MSTGQWDDPEYPYLPRYHAPAISPDASVAPLAKHWQWSIRWLVRVIFTFGALAILAGITLTIALFRATTTAWTLSDLDQREVTIRYWHEPPTSEDALPDWLRNHLGDRWWTDVREVDYTGPAWQFSDPPTEDEIRHMLSACGRFRRLTHFTFVSGHFSCDRLRNWPSLQSLEHLDITSTRLSDDDLAIIGRMQNLKYLRLVKGKYTTDALQHLAKLPRLETLILDEVELKAGSAPSAAGFQALASLSIFRSPTINDNIVLSLGALPLLDQIYIGETPLGDRGLAHLLQSGLVRVVNLEKGAVVTDASLTELAKYPIPSQLTLSSSGITNAGVAQLEGQEVTSLNLSHTSATDEVFRSLAKIQGLKSLVLSDTAVTGQGINEWAPSQRLELLDISGIKLTSSSVEQLAKFPCNWLVLARTSLTDKQLLLFVDRDDLAQLDVTQTQVTPEGVVAFYEARKKRLKNQGKQESLTLYCDFPEVAEPYHNPWGSDPLLSADDVPVAVPY